MAADGGKCSESAADGGKSSQSTKLDDAQGGIVVELRAFKNRKQDGLLQQRCKRS